MSHIFNCLLCGSTGVIDFHSFNDPQYGVRNYFKCDDCGLIFLSPLQRLSPEEEKRRYSLHNNNPNDPQYIKFLEKLTNPLIKYLKLGAVGLDYGCGPGPAINQILISKGFEVINYDPYFYLDALALTRKYDFVTCSETAEHFYDPKKEFQQFDNLLNEKGVLGVMTLMFDETIDFSKWCYIKDPTHVCFYSLKTFMWIAVYYNWSVVADIKNVVFLLRNNDGAKVNSYL